MFEIIFMCFVWTFVSAGTGIYRVHRHDFDVRSQSELSPLSSSYPQEMINSQNGVFKVKKQDFTNNDEIPFSQNVYSDRHVLDSKYYTYRERRPFYPKINSENEYGKSSSSFYETTSIPKLFIPAEDESYLPYSQTIRNYNSVLSMSQFERWNGVNNNINNIYNSYNRENVESRIARPLSRASYIPEYETTSSYNDFTTGNTFIPQSSDDGILPAVSQSLDDEKPLPPISTFLRPGHQIPVISSNADNNKHITYHSINDLVEISDEHKELLESFQDSNIHPLNLTLLPVAKPIPIRRRRRRCVSQNCEYYPFDVSHIDDVNSAATIYNNNALNLFLFPAREILEKSKNTEMRRPLSLPLMMPSVPLLTILLIPGTKLMPIPMPMPMPVFIVDEYLSNNIDKSINANITHVSLFKNEKSSSVIENYEHLKSSTNDLFSNETERLDDDHRKRIIEKTDPANVSTAGENIITTTDNVDQFEKTFRLSPLDYTTNKDSVMSLFVLPTYNFLSVASNAKEFKSINFLIENMGEIIKKNTESNNYWKERLFELKTKKENDVDVMETNKTSCIENLAIKSFDITLNITDHLAAEPEFH